MTRKRVLIGRELAFHRHTVPRVSSTLPVDDRLGEVLTLNLLLDGVDCGDVRHSGVVVHHRRRVYDVPRDAPVSIARKVEVKIHWRAELQVAKVYYWLAPTLHGHHLNHAARPLRPGCRAASTAEACTGPSRAEIGPAFAPSPSEAADVLCRYARFGFLPLRRLGNAVGYSEKIVAPFQETVGSPLNVVLVVRAINDPLMHDRESQCGIGARLDRNPFTAEKLCSFVVVRIDVNKLDAQGLRPLTALSGLCSGVNARSAFRVTGPEDNHLRVFQAVFNGTVETW